MKKTINKIIAFSLSFALLIIGAIPAFSIQAAPAEKLPEIVEYSNGGKPASEIVSTGKNIGLLEVVSEENTVVEEDIVIENTEDVIIEDDVIIDNVVVPDPEDTESSNGDTVVEETEEAIPDPEDTESSNGDTVVGETEEAIPDPEVVVPPAPPIHENNTGLPTAEVTIIKEWLTPEKAQPVTIHLFADGTEVKQATLSADNNWTITYDNLPTLKDGKKITYSVKEDAIKDIEVKYLDPVIKGDNITFKVTNEYVVRYKDVTVKKDWVIPSDNLQVAISDDNGYTTDFFKVEFYNHDESQLLETVNSYSYSNVVATKNKYPLDSSYVAYVYYNKTDNPIKVVINETPVKLVPIDVNITTSEGVQTVTLSKDNNWTQTVQVRADGDFQIEEVTTGNWTSNIVQGDLTVITNTIENNNKVVLVNVPVSDVPVTGNVNYSGFFVAVMTLGFIGLATVSYTKKKKHR